MRVAGAGGEQGFVSWTRSSLILLIVFRQLLPRMENRSLTRGLAARVADRTAELEAENDARILVEETVDVTAAPRRRKAGSRHPLSTLPQRVADIFAGIGWETAQGPAVEAEWFTFDPLNPTPQVWLVGGKKAPSPDDMRAIREYLLRHRLWWKNEDGNVHFYTQDFRNFVNGVIDDEARKPVTK